MRRTYLHTLALAEREWRAALTQGDWQRAGLAAHRVKSSSHAVGAHGLGRLLDAFERTARAPDAGIARGERMVSQLTAIDAALVRVRQALAEPGPSG